ncbi:MAG: hypothetical protein JW969_20385 [Spirochaetales bacterium]|nr:hypothetical protein [Spirochaetales bacterium]
MNKKRLTFAVILQSFFENSYENEIWKAIREVAALNDVNLIIFSGIRGSLFKRETLNFSIVYDVIDSSYIDGIISLTGVLATRVKIVEIKKFLSKKIKENIPVVSIGFEIDNCFNVVVDNKNSFKKIILHIIKDHKIKNIHFVTGPEDNEEANLRFDAYKEALEENNIKYDDNHIINGDFRPITGSLVIKEIRLSLFKRILGIEIAAATC